jgi:hypothetical protein
VGRYHFYRPIIGGPKTLVGIVDRDCGKTVVEVRQSCAWEWIRRLECGAVVDSEMCGKSGCDCNPQIRPREEVPAVDRGVVDVPLPMFEESAA